MAKSINTANVPGMGAKVRRGFYDHTRSTWRAVRRFIEKHEPQIVCFTGHSLGGACATIASELAILTYPVLQNTVYCVTFGAPRVLTPYAARIYNDDMNGRCTRFVIPGDLVPSVPFMTLYRHAKGRFLLNGIDHSERREITSSLGAVFNNTLNLFQGILTGAENHDMDIYWHRVSNSHVHPAMPLDLCSPTEGYRVYGTPL